MGRRLDVVAHPVRSLYQPIVALVDQSVVAVEALTRGGSGGDELPAALFSAAASEGTTPLLDEACLRAALRGIADATVPATLFVNMEPATLGSLSPRRFAELAALAAPGVQVVLEVTERDLLERPAELVRGVQRVRELGWAVALDDVGAEAAGLALLPFLCPDVIKLDLGLVRERTTLHVAGVVNAVRAQAERTGALVLAEGIETEQHLERALAMGAGLGQGWLFGRPGPLPTEPMTPLTVRRTAPPGPPAHATPFDLVSARTPALRAGVPLLAAMARHLEHQAMLLDDQAVVLTCLQHANLLTPRTRRRYASLAAVTALTAVLARDMPDTPAPGVQGTALEPGDPVEDQWVVVVVGPHFAAVLVARDLPADDGPVHPGGTPGSSKRRLEHVLTYDRELALAAGRLLLSRVRPRGPEQEVPTLATPSASDLRVPPAELPHLLLRAISTASNGIVIADARLPDQPLVYANDAFLRLTGYRLSEVIGRNCRFLQGPGTDMAQVRPVRQQLLAGREVQLLVVNHRRDGSPFWNEVTISPVRDDVGEVTHYIGHQADVTDRVERERRTAHLAYHDELTGLPNRAHVLEHLDLELRRARRSGQGVAVVLLDLDGFKDINDRLGHAAGDLALVRAAERLTGAVRAGDLVGRLGGDEFLVVLAGLPADTREAEAVVEVVRQHLHDALRSSLEIGGAELRLQGSSGVALHRRDGTEAAALVAHADADMYRHKPAR